MLSSVFSDYNWLPWKFKNVPQGFWQEKNNQRLFLDYVYNDLKMENMEGWYSVSREQIIAFGGKNFKKIL